MPLNCKGCIDVYIWRVHTGVEPPSLEYFNMMSIMINRLTEFFEEDDGSLSMSRLVFFLSFFPAAWHVVTTHLDALTFVTTYAGTYVVSKHGGNLIDAIGNNGKQVQDKDEGTQEPK